MVIDGRPRIEDFLSDRRYYATEEDYPSMIQKNKRQKEKKRDESSVSSDAVLVGQTRTQMCDTKSNHTSRDRSMTQDAHVRDIKEGWLHCLVLIHDLLHMDSECERKESVRR